MIALLPALTLGTIAWGLSGRLGCWRSALIVGAVIWGALLVCITELLSALNSLSVSGITASWLVALLASGLALLTGRRRLRRPHPFATTGGQPDSTTAVAWGLLAVVSALGVVAVLSPPNTWDSMTYHMARLIHWMEDGNLAPYPTHILRQLYLQPGAEFVLLHLQLLSGGDRLAGLVQWASMLLSVLVGIPLIARDLGAGRSGQLAASVFALSVPIGVLESTSTQNDWVVTAWLVCVGALALRITRASTSGIPWAAAAAFGASLGLAVLTKATAYLFGLPVVILLVVRLVGTHRWRALGPLILAATLALLLNAGFYARNLTLFGSPVGPFDEGSASLRYLNDELTPTLLASNLVRDVGVNFVATPLKPFNTAGETVVRVIHVWLGVDAADPRTTWGSETFVAQPGGLAFDENFASNPVHLVLIFATLGLVVLRRRQLPPQLGWCALTLMGGFALFGAVLRWQPWHTRLELPIFVLAAPLVAATVDRLMPRISLPLAGVLLVTVLPWVAYNQARPLVGPRSILGMSRDDSYFTNQPGLRSDYLRAVALLRQRGCNRLGFISSADGWEYPLWPLMQESTPDGERIEHVAVANVSAGAGHGEDAGFQPCAVVSLAPDAGATPINLAGKTYRPASVPSLVTVLTVDGT